MPISTTRTPTQILNYLLKTEANCRYSDGMLVTPYAYTNTMERAFANVRDELLNVQSEEKK